MTKLKWHGDAEAEGRFFVQTERIRGEGVCYFLEGHGPWQRAIELSQHETAFYGRGGKSKVKAAAQRIVDDETN